VTAVTVAELIARARAKLSTGGVPPDEAAADAEVLARHALGWNLSKLVVEQRNPAPAEFSHRYEELISRRLTREPVSQIVGHREFWGLEFEVTRDVLTPRPETETLVESALAAFPRNAHVVIMDVGTGSGCLAVALATEFPNARLIASDVSEPALIVARRNASAHGVEGQISFLHTSDIPPQGAVDLIVSNPPYVALRDAGMLPAEVRRFEPHIALFAGEDGLDVYRKLLVDGRRVISKDGRMILELGYDQAARVIDLARAANWEVDGVRRDLQGIERALTLRPAGED
jgi:release factor glutamine methyltransferase